MPKITFLKTDPLIIMVEKMMKELRDNGNYQIVGYTNITSDGIHRDGNNEFSSWYNFTTTAAVVMRFYMLQATDMLQHHDPYISHKEEHEDAWIYSIGQGDEENPINMAANAYEAKHLSAEFDRQMPHYVLENEFDGMEPEDRRSYTSLMFVVDFENQEVYHIVSSLTVTLEEMDLGRMIIKAIPFIAVFKLRLQNLPVNPNPDTHPNTKKLKDLLAEYYARVDENVLPDIQSLHLEDDDTDDDIEDE